MNTSPSIENFSSIYTFGRDHKEAPPLPSDMTFDQLEMLSQMANPATGSLLMAAASLPNDFDHIVRSIGEW